MAVSEERYTRGQLAFIEAYLSNGHDRERAEKAAKLAPRTGYALLNNPKVQKRITDEQMGRLASEGFPLAVSRLISIVKDDKKPVMAHVAASKYLIEKFFPDDKQHLRREIHEMTGDEIAHELEKLQAAARSRAEDARPVIEAQAVEIDSIFD